MNLPWIHNPISKSFSLRLVVILSSIIFLIFGMTGYAVYRLHQELFMQEVSKQLQKTNDQMAARLDTRIRELYRISNLISFHPMIEDALRLRIDNLDLFERIRMERQLGEQLNQLSSEAPEVMGVKLTSGSGKSLYLGKTNLEFDLIAPFDRQRLDELVQDSHGEFIWERLKVKDPQEYDKQKEILIAGRLMLNSQLEQYGSMLLLLDSSFLINYLTELTEGNRSEAFLYDNTGKPLLTGRSDQNFESLPDINDRSAQWMDQGPRGSYLYLKSRSEHSKFVLLSRISLVELNKKNDVILRIFLISLLLGIVTAGIFIFVASRRLLLPLKDLVLGMKRIRKGQFGTLLKVNTRDEFAFLGDSFNEMSQHIHTLITEVYQRQLSEREAELKALQAQLNPHFLFNTLDMFFWKFYMLEEEHSANLVSSLSSILRYSLGNINQATKLEVELQHIQNYLDIQSERQQNQLIATIKADEQVLNCAVFRLMLQPIVENAFVHAFKDKQDDKQLTILAFIQGTVPSETEQLIVEVKDNGCGMFPEEMDRLMSYEPRLESDGRVQLGIHSVRRRIQLLYGTPYGIEIESEPNAGTTVRLRLPFTLIKEDLT